MKPRVFILATCRKQELLPATLLVFDTLRVGFPTADVVVMANGNDAFDNIAIRAKCKETDSQFICRKRTGHYQWIEALMEDQRDQSPFYLLDTDVVFWNKVEDWEFTTAIAGRAMPEFFDRHTKCMTAPRIHTCLMYVNPQMLHDELDKLWASFPEDFGGNDLVNPYKSFFCIDPRGRRIYYDTAAMLSYMVSKTEFTDNQNRRFDHMNCGTYADVVEPVYPGIIETHRKIYKDPSLLSGAWDRQKRFFQTIE